MRKEELALLAEKVEEGSATEKELALYIGTCEALHTSFLKDSGRWSEIENDLPAMEAASLQKFWARQKPVGHNTYPLWKKTATIAAAVAAITLGVWLHYTTLSSRAPGDLNQYASQNDTNYITPGRNTATLTLANGDIINLDTTKTSVVATDSVKTTTMLTAATPRGGTYKVVLPDGTKVWLNADSKITFPSQFLGSKREVSITGEIYFEVAHNKAKPFIVQSADQTVEVLGTHFNISSYPDERTTKTTLLEGSVSVTSLRGRESANRGNLPGRGPSTTPDEAAIILKPNQQASVGNNKITIKEVDANASVAWKNGEFYLDEMDFKTAMRQIARWYDVTIVYEDNVEKNLKTGGWISRNEKLSSVLRSMELAGPIRFKIEGKKVIVYSKTN